jgi:DNA polymerase III subunit alpha
VLRKAMGKKKLEVMLEQKQKFVEGAKRLGKDGRKAEALWDYIEPFAGYGFNKSHSVAYAVLAYQTAFLKAHHPVAFMAAMLTSEMASKDNVAKYMHECREMGIAVLPPDVNESNWSFTVVGDTIRFGLGAVKGIGESAVEEVLAARNRVGRFRSLAHFAGELDLRTVNHKAFECLLRAGAFDGFGCSRAAQAAALDGILGWAQRRREDQAAGQGLLFAGGAAREPAPDATLPEWAQSERLRHEKETLGFYLTGSPLSQHAALLAGRVTHTTAELREVVESAGVVAVAGVVARPKRIKIKSGANAGRMRAQFSLEDEHGSVLVSLFADTLQKYDALLQDDAVLLVRGTLRMRTELELNAQELVAISALELEQVTHLDLQVGPRVGEAQLLRLRDLLADHAGELPVRLIVERRDGQVLVAPASRFKVRYGAQLVDAIEGILGAGSVTPVRQVVSEPPLAEAALVH